MSAAGTLEILENTELNGKNVIPVKGKVTELGGLFGFIVKLLPVYKGSDTFDSYIVSDTRITTQYEMYKQNENGSRKINEQIYFDRKNSKVVSLESNKTVVNNAPPDIQDAFSIFLNLLSRFNNEEIFVGKKYEVNFYAYKKAAKIKIEVTNFSLVNGKAIYTMEIKELPAVFKYPASVWFQVADVGDGFMSVTEGECRIRLTTFPDIILDLEVKLLKLAG